VDYESLQKSLRHLEEQYQNLMSLGKCPDLPFLIQEAIKESVIQRFETCYDTLWKHLKRHMVKELGLPEGGVPNSPKPVLRLAHENELLQDIDIWLEYAQIRIDTSHDYSQEKMANALRHMGSFISNAVIVYETMTKTKWEK